MKEVGKKQRAVIFGRNASFLRREAGLTIAGAAAAFRLSDNHLRLIEKGETNIRAKNAKVIADFFNTDTETLYSAAFPPVKDIEEMSAVKKFRKANKAKVQFFTISKKQNSVADFRREHFLTEQKYFPEDKKDGEIGKAFDEERVNKMV